MEHVERLACKKVRFRGLVNSFSQAIPFLAYAIAFYYGGLMVANDEIHYKDLVRYVQNDEMLFSFNKLIRFLYFQNK